MTFNSEREALRALVDAVHAYGQTEEYGDDQAERDAMFDVMHEASEYLTMTEPDGVEGD